MIVAEPRTQTLNSTTQTGQDLRRAVLGYVRAYASLHGRRKAAEDLGVGPVCLRSTSLESPYDYWGRYTQSKQNPSPNHLIGNRTLVEADEMDDPSKEFGIIEESAWR